MPANAILLRMAYAQKPLSGHVDISSEASGLTLVRTAYTQKPYFSAHANVYSGDSVLNFGLTFVLIECMYPQMLSLSANADVFNGLDH